MVPARMLTGLTHTSSYRGAMVDRNIAIAHDPMTSKLSIVNVDTALQ